MKVNLPITVVAIVMRDDPESCQTYVHNGHLEDGDAKRATCQAMTEEDREDDQLPDHTWTVEDLERDYHVTVDHHEADLEVTLPREIINGVITD